MILILISQMVRFTLKSLSPWSSRELVSRRNNLMNKLSHDGTTVTLVRGMDPLLQCGVPLPTKQKSYFRYLTGCLLPCASFLIQGHKGRIERTVLFYNRRTRTEQLWDGDEKSIDEMKEQYHVDQVEPASSLYSYIEQLATPSTLFVCEVDDFVRMKDVMNRCKVTPLNRILDGLRLVKSEEERKAMALSCSIGSDALSKSLSWNEKTEAAFAARLALEYVRNGAFGPAYPSVVAGGDRACTVHYLDLSHPFYSGDCVLVDAGCDMDGYLSDISRVFPVNGRFSQPQRVLYDILETVQLTLIEEAKSGDLVLNSLFDSMHYLLNQLLEEANIFSQNISLSQRQKVVEDISLHHVGHYLGLDVHDSPSIKRSIRMPPGTVFTIEPGIYIRRDNDLIKKEFHGIGMRIEDDLLVEEGDTVTVLTQSCPKSIYDIEKAANS